MRKSGHGLKERSSSHCSTLSETSSDTDKTSSPRQEGTPPGSVPESVPVTAHEPPGGVSRPTLVTRRSVKELLETRETPSKMEIGAGVMLTADIKGAELVIIQGTFE
ncbi:unnamed protein product, partial [Sphacelaria rigidula]